MEELFLRVRVSGKLRNFAIPRA